MKVTLLMRHANYKGKAYVKGDTLNITSTYYSNHKHRFEPVVEPEPEPEPEPLPEPEPKPKKKFSLKKAKAGALDGMMISGVNFDDGGNNT